MKRLTASDFPEAIWEYGTAEVKRCLRTLRRYARIDWYIPEAELEEAVKEAMGVCWQIDNDEVLWEALNLVIIETKKVIRGYRI